MYQPSIRPLLNHWSLMLPSIRRQYGWKTALQFLIGHLATICNLFISPNSSSYLCIPELSLFQSVQIISILSFNIFYTLWISFRFPVSSDNSSCCSFSFQFNEIIDWRDPPQIPEHCNRYLCATGTYLTLYIILSSPVDVLCYLQIWILCLHVQKFSGYVPAFFFSRTSKNFQSLYTTKQFLEQHVSIFARRCTLPVPKFPCPKYRILISAQFLRTTFYLLIRSMQSWNIYRRKPEKL